MALLDDIVIGDIVIGGNVVTGLAIGVGALIAWPLIGPVARPLAKSVIKGGLIAYRQAEQLYAGAIEGVGDIVAEAQQEVGATTPVKGDPARRTSRAT
jgi:Protein of unknown function (DUF5132)